MHKMKFLATLATLLLSSVLVSAQAMRTWVSGVGDDANPCSRTAPCKTFAGAIAKTAPGGEIDALDPGGFGALTITKSITLDGGGGQVASVLVQGTNGIVVAAGPNDVVIIRNMRLNGLLGGGNGNAGLNGIRWLSGKQLVIENCVIFGFSQNGIDIALTQNTPSEAHIFNTSVENVNGVGIRATNNQTPNVQVGVDNSQVRKTSLGIEAAANSRIIVTRSVVEHAANDGIKADAATSEVNVSFSDISYNTNGITATTGGGANAAFNNLAYNSSCGLNQVTGSNTFYSFGNNRQVGAGSCGNITGLGQN